MAIADFGMAIRTDQGGFFRCFGGRPDQVEDRLTTLGQPEIHAWQIRLTDRAPTSGVGAIIPLFDETNATNRVPVRIGTGQQLTVRLIGKLEDRHLRIEVVADKNPEAVGTTIGTIESGQLGVHQWSEFQLPLPRTNRTGEQASFIRIVADGQRSAWFAIDSVRLTQRNGRPVAPKRKSAEAHPLRTALWVWHTKEILPDRSQIDRLLDLCSREGITDLFFQIPYSYDEGVVRLQLPDKQRQFNAAADSRGIVVHALDGAPEYALSENHVRMSLFLDALGNLNAKAAPEQRYKAIHLDNEPYLLVDWKHETERLEIIDDYIALNRKLSSRAKSLGMEYGVDIPFWWDDRDRDGTVKYTHKTEAGKQAILAALFPLVDNVGVMSYRDRVTGPNGLVAHCLDEFKLGQEFGVDVFASAELGVGDAVDQGTTFGVYPWSYFRGQLETLKTVLSHTPGCAGLAIHYAKPFAEAMQ